MRNARVMTWRAGEYSLAQKRGYTRLIDTANAPIFGVDTFGRVTVWNECARRLIGYSTKEIMGRSLVQDFITDARSSPRGRRTANFEFPLITKSGYRIEVILNATSRHDEQGNPGHYRKTVPGEEILQAHWHGQRADLLCEHAGSSEGVELMCDEIGCRQLRHWLFLALQSSRPGWSAAVPMWDARMTTTLWLWRSVVAALAYGLASLLHVNNKTYIHENDYAVVEKEIKQIYMEQFTLLCFMEIKITTFTSHPWEIKPMDMDLSLLFSSGICRRHLVLCIQNPSHKSK